MKRTALNDIDITLGANMVPFAGYNMPVSKHVLQKKEVKYSSRYVTKN